MKCTQNLKYMLAAPCPNYIVMELDYTTRLPNQNTKGQLLHNIVKGCHMMVLKERGHASLYILSRKYKSRSFYYTIIHL